MAIKIDKNMQASGKLNLVGFTRGNTSKQHESKDKAVASRNEKSYGDSLKELTEVIKAMEANHATQLNVMHNRWISMERSQANKFQPRKNNERWKIKGAHQDQRPPNQLKATNMVQQEAPPFYQTCEKFHEESTCPVFCRINEQGLPETSNYVGYPGRPSFINNVSKTNSVTNDQWK
jgi:hypothetical protein